MRFYVPLQQWVVDDDILALSIFGLSHFHRSLTICFSTETKSEDAPPQPAELRNIRNISEEKDTGDPRKQYMDSKCWNCSV